MKFVGSIRMVPVLLAFALVVLGSPKTTQAQQQDWQATVGAQTSDKSHQAQAFLPNEIWIHAGDSITWTAKADNIHTVTFLTAAQPIPPFQLNCPGASLNTADFDGSVCVSTPPLAKGQTITVRFPSAGNFKVECLVHNAMTGTIHVLDDAATLPHDQEFYDEQAAAQAKVLFSESTPDMRMHDDEESVRVYSGNKRVLAGFGELTATPGGTQLASLARFLHGTIQVHQGDTVEWSNSDPQEPHTITFGKEPANLFLPSMNVKMDADGARHVTLNSTGDSAHSGFIVAAAQDNTGDPSEHPLSVTRFRVTFKAAGIYPYICALHDNLGMVGKVVVLP